MLPTDRTVVFDTSFISGFTTTLSFPGITSTTQITFSIGSGTNIVNGTYIKIDSEFMYVSSGGGPGTGPLTVIRGGLGSTAVTHSSGATISIGGPLTFTLLPISQIPNQGMFFQKITTDINYVIIEAGSEGSPLVQDTFDSNGDTEIILADTSATLGQQVLQAPGNS